MSANRASVWATLEAAKRRHERASMPSQKRATQTPESVHREAVAALQLAFSKAAENPNASNDPQTLIDEALKPVEGLHLLGNVKDVDVKQVKTAQKGAALAVKNAERLLRRLKRVRDRVEKEVGAIDGGG